jgi:spore coat protein JB
MSDSADCGYKNGTLPACAPLGISYVPMQGSAKPAYAAEDALSRGTLFPGLDLPFMNMVNKTPGTSTPLRELMAIDFVLAELNLYLDTHRNDKEAFAAWQSMAALAQEARRRYVDLCGPVTQMDMTGDGSYTWLNDPWPWDMAADKEG